MKKRKLFLLLITLIVAVGIILIFENKSFNSNFNTPQKIHVSPVVKQK